MGVGYDGKKGLSLNWASHCWHSFQNFILLQRIFFWIWVGGWFGQIYPPPPPVRP